MALILLVLIGVLAGWFGSIATRTEDKSAIRRQILVALIASLLVGILANGGTFMGRLDWLAAGAAIIACVAALAGNHYFLKRSPEA